MLACRLLLVSSSSSVKERRFADIKSSVADKLRQLTEERGSGAGHGLGFWCGRIVSRHGRVDGSGRDRGWPPAQQHPIRCSVIMPALADPSGQRWGALAPAPLIAILRSKTVTRI